MVGQLVERAVPLVLPRIPRQVDYPPWGQVDALCLGLQWRHDW